MTGSEELEEAGATSAVRLAASFLAGAALLAAMDAGAIAIGLPMPVAGLGLRLADHAFDAAETLGVGGLAALAAAAFARFVRVPPWASFGAAVAGTMVVVHQAIGNNIARGVEFTVPGRLGPAVYVLYLAMLGVFVPWACSAAAQVAERPPGRLGVVTLALVVLVADQLPARDDYQGLHGVVAAGAALVGGVALGPDAERWLRARVRGVRGRVVLSSLALFAVLGLVVPPPNAVRYELFRQPCAVAPWVLATALWRAPRTHAPAAAPVALAAWSRDRSEDPHVPPTSPRLLPPDAVVVLITIDAVRADALGDPADDALFPTLTALRKRGVVFTHASAAGTQTPLSLAALFSGRTFSEQLWTEHGEGKTRFLFPAADTSVRFPEVLSGHGVATFDVAGVSFLASEYGVLRGFREESIAVQGTEHAKGAVLVDRLLDRLRRHRRGPLFLYTHLMEPHAPYDRGRQDGTDRERYLSEIAVADAQVGRVLQSLEQRFPERWALVVSSDHGEAFGEHASHDHAKSLYEELVHVPLIAASPVFAPRTVDERVGLVDLGPTILDLFGLDTPATFLGQSLVPILAGGDASLTRPLFAEGRLRRKLTMPEGLEVIEDARRKVVEVYDLDRDPGETRNLFDVEPSRSDVALVSLRTFFDAHTRTSGGYVPPYEP